MENSMESSIKKKLIIMCSLLLVIVVGIGITFAFFSPSVNQNADVTVDVTTSDIASVKFQNGSELILDAPEPGVSESAYFSVNVKSNGGNVTGVYDVYWVISSNSFIHDLTDGNENDKEITYNLYTSSDNSSWTPVIIDGDATDLTGEIQLAANEIVTASNGGSTTKYYKLQVTYPSLDKDQSYNMNKRIDSYLEIRPSM